MTTGQRLGFSISISNCSRRTDKVSFSKHVNHHKLHVINENVNPEHRTLQIDKVKNKKLSLKKSQDNINLNSKCKHLKNHHCVLKTFEHTTFDYLLKRVKELLVVVK